MNFIEHFQLPYREHGRLDVLRKLVKVKFGSIGPPYSVRMECARGAYLDHCLSHILSARTVDEVFIEELLAKDEDGSDLDPMAVARKIKEEGVVEGQREVLRKLLVMRFGRLDPSDDQTICGASGTNLSRYFDRILDGGSVYEVLDPRI